jgi:hypothetical protein
LRQWFPRFTFRLFNSFLNFSSMPCIVLTSFRLFLLYILWSHWSFFKLTFCVLWIAFHSLQYLWI